MAEPTSAPDYTLPEPRELSRREFIQLLEERCQRELGMSLHQFLKAWDAGELPDTPSVMHIAVLVGERAR